jgi:peptidoglycan/LPS O-acetylase OafA/YrhL
VRNQRFCFIDALRGIASLGVVLFHAVEGNHVNSLPAVFRTAAWFGSFGVPIFFVISGFVIAHSLRDQEMTPGRMAGFVVRRSIRLDPPYWTAIVLAIGFSILASRLVPGRPVDQFSVGQVLAHLTYTQIILGYQNINPVFWTLCYEIQFYIVYAAILFVPSRHAIVAAMGLSLLWCFRIAPDVQGWFPQLWYAFLLGTAAWLAWTRREFLPVFVGYLILVCTAALWWRDGFAFACCVTSALIFVVGMSGKLATALNWRWLQFLGLLSYSLYLVHNPITGAVFRVGTRILGDGPLAEGVIWAASILICILSAYALWLVVERPSMALSKYLSKRKAPFDVQTGSPASAQPLSEPSKS